MLMQPLPLPVQLMTEGFIPFSGSSNLVSGAALLCIAVAKARHPAAVVVGAGACRAFGRYGCDPGCLLLLYL